MAKLIDLTGKRFGKVTVLQRHVPNLSGRVAWNCLCDCGKQFAALGVNLWHGRTTSCTPSGCDNRTADLTGLRFGKLTVVRRAAPQRSNPMWECLCDCGATTTVRADGLRGNAKLGTSTKSCGCIPASRGGIWRTKGYYIERYHKRRAREAKTGGHFTAEQIDKLYVLQRGKCAVCGKRIAKDAMHRDHIISIVAGGSNDISNIQLLCQPCNQSKGAMDPIKFMQQKIGKLL